MIIVFFFSSDNQKRKTKWKKFKNFEMEMYLKMHVSFEQGLR